MNTPEQRIKIALQKSGRLTDHSLDLLARCGLNFTQSKDQLFCYGENMPVDLLLVRDDDIPGLVSDEVCDLGIAGLNVIQEKRLGLQKNGKPALFDQVYALDFGHCRRPGEARAAGVRPDRLRRGAPHDRRHLRRRRSVAFRQGSRQRCNSWPQAHLHDGHAFTV